MTGRWLRLYDEVLDDPKVQRLPPALFKRWVNLLCVASRHDGRLPAIADLEFALRDGAASICADLAALEAVGLIDRDGDGFAPHNWSGRQFRSDSSTSRVKRHRERQEQRRRSVAHNVSGNDHETFHETHQSRAETEQNRTQADKVGSPESTETAKQQPRAREPLPGSSLDDNQLRAALLEAAGIPIDRMPATMRSVRPIRELMGDGFDLAGDILPVLRSKRGKASPKSWSYYTAAIREEERGTTTSLPPDQMTVAVAEDDPRWPVLAQRYCFERKMRDCPRDRSGGWRFPVPWVAEASGGAA